MIYKSPQFEVISPNVIEESKLLPAIMSDDDAQVSLAKFLRYNLGFTWNLLSDCTIFGFQEFVLNTWFKKDYCLYVASRAIGKSYNISIFCLLYAIFYPKTKIVIVSSNFRRCLKGDAWIKDKNKGLLRYRDVSVANNVLSKDSYNNVLNRWDNRIEPSIKITTQRGYSIEGLLEHRVLVYNPELAEFQYKRLDELKEDEIIPIKRGDGNFGNKSVFDFASLPASDSHLQKDCFIYDSTDLYYYLGLCLGDGYISDKLSGEKTNYRICFGNNDQQLLDFFEQYSNKICANNLVYSGKNKTQCNIRSISNKTLVFFLKELGFVGTATQKDIPDFLFACKKEYIAAFIRGLMDTDGSVCVRDNSCEVKLSTSSKKIAEKFQILLLNFGIFSSIVTEAARGETEICGVKTYGNESYSVKIYSHSQIKIYYEEIGFGLDRKNNILNNYILNFKPHKGEDIFIIPELGKYIKAKYKGFSRLTDSVGLSRIREICFDNKRKNTYLGEEDKSKIEALLTENFYFDRLKKKEYGESETIDIEVENESCYWANGFINHNSKDIFSKIEGFLRSKDRNLLKANFPDDISKLPDKYILRCTNGSEILGLPLGQGENLRGERANVLIIDEGLLVSKHIQETVLEPFILADLNLDEKLKTRAREDKLIENGLMTEEGRQIFPRNKIIVCSSASYQFEHLYEGIFLPHIKNITESKGEKDSPTFSVTRSSYHIGLRAGIIQQSAIDKVHAEELMDDPVIGREYWGRFSDNSNGFFSLRKIRECTVDDGDFPTVQLHSTSKKQEVILAIDPSFSSGPASDYFVILAALLMPEDRRICQIHTYARAGGEIKDHYEYLTFMLKNFNVIWLIVDATGTDAQFIKEYNESAIAKDNRVKLNFIDADFEEDGEGYVRELKKAKSQWNVLDRRFVYKHTFSSTTNRKTNEFLSSQINSKKVWFGSRITQNKESFDKFKNFTMPYDFKDSKGRPHECILDYITDQDDLIRRTQDQLALIHVSSTANGAQTFDLPSYCSRDDNPDRVRKDLYSAIMMATYAAKHVFDMNSLNIEKEESNFMPFFIQ